MNLIDKKNCILIFLDEKDFLNYFVFLSFKFFTARQMLLSAKYLEI